MVRLLATAVVVTVGWAVVLTHEPPSSVCPHLPESDLSAPDPHEALLDQFLADSDDVVETLTQQLAADSTCPAMQQLAQPVLKWYEFIERDLRLDPDRANTVHWQLHELSRALMQRRPAAIRFVTMMRPRSACDLLEKILHHPDVRYDRRARLLQALRSLQPALFSVDIEQIPPAIRTLLQDAYDELPADVVASTEPTSPESIAILEQLFPDPLYKFVRFHRQMQARLIERLRAPSRGDSAESPLQFSLWAEAVPPLARLGIQLPFTDCLHYEGFPYSVYPYLSTKALWKTVKTWLDESEQESLERLTRAVIRLLSMPEFIRDLRRHPHTFGLFVIFLHDCCPLAYTRLFAKLLHERAELAAVKGFVLDQIRQRHPRRQHGTGPFDFVKSCFTAPSDSSDM